MDAKGLKSAKLSAASARRNLEEMRTAPDLVSLESKWSDFFGFSKSILIKLEQAPKSGVKSQPCYGKMKHVRNNDELPRYVFHVRNEDERGIERITYKKDVVVTIGALGKTAD